MSASVLFEPFQLGSLRLPNRVVMSPMSRYFSPGGVPAPAFADYYRRRAEGQVGLVVTGATGIERPMTNNDPNLALFHGDALPVWQTVVDDVHRVGGRIALQLWHSGALQNRDPDWKPAPVESPSGINAPAQIVGEPMSESAIADTIAAFGRAAREAERTGFDAIELHAAHGFLIDQFFWDLTNRRGDRWGGASLGERTRFAVEVIRAVRAALSGKTPIVMRVSQWKIQDVRAKLARSPEEMRAWLEPLAEAGLDALHCSQRRFWEPEFEGSDLNFAGWAKKLTGKPTITVGSVGLDAELGARAAQPAALDRLMHRMERGEFDLVAVGRALLADPDWLVKLREGRHGDMLAFDAGALSALV